MAKRSEIFQDDQGVVIEKRCFLLLCGPNDHDSNYLTIQIHVNVFKSPREPLKVDFSLKMENTMIEICNEVIQSQTMLLPEFRAFFRYEDLFNCKPKLNRKIELYAPLYAVKQ